MEKKLSWEYGLLSLEASIALTIFIFLMLFMYSLFVVFEARNTIGHAVLATANSLALDAYDSSQLGDGETLASIFHNVYGTITHGGMTSNFADSRKWYEDSVVEDGNSKTLSADFLEAIQTRFCAYLGGSSAAGADEVLRRYHIQNGKEGLDFSNSYVDADGNLHLSVQYTIKYEFQVFNLDALNMEQKACSKLWK